MANIKSQIKRDETNELAHQKNSAFKAEVRTAEKKVEVAVAANKKDEAQKALLEAIKLLDQCEGAHIIAKNNCNRKKSHLQKLVNGLK
ncbi:MAG: 30S ribosomal protein S20 [Tenericutes bacterium ADurb.BinA155]|jgi:small subunit ribosomal protein S20|nr:MAG: 30S ribosomal protein S20 [Tenericutes bacterium ADurb.BinA155]